jgi:hypothetical protein
MSYESLKVSKQFSAFNLNEWHIGNFFASFTHSLSSRSPTFSFSEPSCFLIDFQCFSKPNNFRSVLKVQLKFIFPAYSGQLKASALTHFLSELQNKLTEKAKREDDGKKKKND